MIILWRKAAQDDLDTAFEYLIAYNPEAALRLFETIRASVNRLADHPALGRAGRVQETRELVIAGTFYLAAYTVDRQLGAMIVLRVLHGRQQWPEDLDP